MMTRKELQVIAEKLAETELNVRAIGMLNMPIETDERIRMDAAYKVLGDLVIKRRAEYDAAFNQWYQEGMPE